MCLKTCHFTVCFFFRHYEHPFLFSIDWCCFYYFLRNSLVALLEALFARVSTARDVVTVLLAFAEYLLLNIHIFTCTYRGTHTQAHMYNQHTRGMATTRHRSLVERGGRKALLETLHTQKKCPKKKPIFSNLKKRFEHKELPAKLLDYLLRNNESNINQSLSGVTNLSLLAGVCAACMLTYRCLQMKW